MRSINSLNWLLVAVASTAFATTTFRAEAQSPRARRTPIVPKQLLNGGGPATPAANEGVVRLKSGAVKQTALQPQAQKSSPPKVTQPVPQRGPAPATAQPWFSGTQQVQFQEPVPMSQPAPVATQQYVFDQAMQGPVVQDIYYGAYGDMSFLGGNFGQAGASTLFLPLLQDQNTLVFSELGGLFGDSGNVQGSFGLGARVILDDSMLVGANAFYDYRQTGLGTEMQQVTFGAELLTYLWEVRANGYISDGKSGYFNPQAALQGNRLWLDSTFEQSFSGFDFEGGALLLTNDLNNFELRGFTGGYYFQPNGIGNDIGGAKGRLEARLYDLPQLGAGSRLTLGGEATWDQVRDVQFTGLAQLRIPLGGNRQANYMDPFSRRMLDRVVRQHQVLADNVDIREPVASGLTGVPIVNTVFANNATFTADVNAAGFHSLVIANGNITTTGATTLSPGQTILGGGATLPIVGTQTGTTGTFTAPGTRPTITSTNAAQAVLRPATDTALIGLDIVNGQRGVDVHTNRDIFLSNLDIGGSALDGVRVQNGQRITISDTTVHNTGANGIFLRNMDGMTLTNVNVNTVVNNGLLVDGGSGLAISQLAVNGTGGNGVRLLDLSGGTVNGLTIQNAGLDGLLFDNANNIAVSNFLLNTITQDGLQVNNSNNISLFTGQVTNTTGDGLQINTADAIALNNVTFNTIGDDVIEFIGNPTNLSGSGNQAFNFTAPLSTGAVGSGQFLFSTPNTTAP